MECSFPTTKPPLLYHDTDASRMATAGSGFHHPPKPNKRMERKVASLPLVPGEQGCHFSLNMASPSALITQTWTPAFSNSSPLQRFIQLNSFTLTYAINRRCLYFCLRLALKTVLATALQKRLVRSMLCSDISGCKSRIPIPAARTA
jgi:hypothetical protein